MIALLLKLVPWYIRVTAIAVMAGGLWLHGYYKGWSHEHEKLDQVTAGIQHERDVQALAAARKTIQDKERLDEVVSAFHANLAAIDAYWVRQRAQATARMSAEATPATGTTRPSTDAVPAGRSEEADKVSCPDLELLRKQCVRTTAMFNACRDGWISQEQ